MFIDITFCILYRYYSSGNFEREMQLHMTKFAGINYIVDTALWLLRHCNTLFCVRCLSYFAICTASQLNFSN